MNRLLKDINSELEDKNISPRSRQSQEWFKGKLKELDRHPVNRNELTRELKNMNPVRTPHVGRMYIFYYFPKTRRQMPYYDLFPNIFMTDISSKYFQGINLHYLPVGMREDFFLRLLERVNKQNYDKQTFLRITYEYLDSFRRFRAFKSCWKRYDYKQVRGNIINVPSSEWENVMYLPTAMFRKKPEEIVHIESRKRYRNT